MDDETRKRYEEYVNNPDASDRVRFHAELFLLFDKYDPVNPDVDLDVETFIGILEKEKDALFFHYMMAMDEYLNKPEWERQ